MFVFVLRKRSKGFCLNVGGGDCRTKSVEAKVTSHLKNQKLFSGEKRKPTFELISLNFFQRIRM